MAMAISPCLLFSIIFLLSLVFFFFFFNDPATTEIYTLSLHDALPIPPLASGAIATACHCRRSVCSSGRGLPPGSAARLEEHTSELQSPDHLVCRLLLEKKKKKKKKNIHKNIKQQIICQMI